MPLNFLRLFVPSTNVHCLCMLVICFSFCLQCVYLGSNLQYLCIKLFLVQSLFGHCVSRNKRPQPLYLGNLLHWLSILVRNSLNDSLLLNANCALSSAYWCLFNANCKLPTNYCSLWNYKWVIQLFKIVNWTY